MQEIRDESQSCPATAPPILLACIADAPPPSTKPSPSIDEPLLSRIDIPGPQIPIGTAIPIINNPEYQPTDGEPVPFVVSHEMAPTPFNEVVGFPSLLPILFLAPDKSIQAVTALKCVDNRLDRVGR